MAKNTDILIGNDIDLIVWGGDLVVGDSTLQNQYLILASQKGEFKEHPMFGAGISDCVNDDDATYWKHRINEELKRDGMTVRLIRIKKENLQISAEYNENNR